jgi:ATP-binding cassette subfamily B protein
MPDSPATHSLAHYILARKRLVLGCLIAGLVSVGLNLWLPYLIRVLVDTLVAGEIEKRWLFQQVGLYFCIALIAASGSLWMRRLPQYLTHRIIHHLRGDVFARLIKMDTAFYNEQRTGDVMTRMNADIRAVGDMVGQGLMNIVRALLAFTIGYIIMFKTHVQLATVMAVLLPLMMAIGFLFVMAIKKRYAASQEQFSEISNFCQESFSGIRLIKSFGIEERQREAFSDLNQTYIQINLGLAKVEAPIWPFLGLLFLFGNLAILFIGGSEVIRGKMSLGTLVQFQQYILYLQWPTLSMSWALGQIMRGRVSWGRVQKLLQAEASVKDSDLTQLDITSVHGDIEFRHVSLELGGVKVLDDINLNIPEGMMLGITGPTGSGKTLLASMLTRQIDPTHGQVFIGVNDIREYPLNILRRDVRMGGQEPFLFSDTLASNIGFGLAEQNDQTIRWAADIAQLSLEAEEFPSGFNTLLGERGVTLSGGQRQRTSIARAIAANPNILVLDDTLSAVDTHTEAQILNGLIPVLKERTSVLVSHRASTLKYADFIIVIEHGRITQMGSHQELINEEGFYRELDTTQRLEAQLEAI